MSTESSDEWMGEMHYPKLASLLYKFCFYGFAKLLTTEIIILRENDTQASCNIQACRGPTAGLGLMLDRCKCFSKIYV